MRYHFLCFSFLLLLAVQYRMDKYLVGGKKWQLKDIDPDDTGKFKGDAGREKCEEKTKKLFERISELQEVLFASQSRALLVVFQAMDGSGKDSAIKYVFQDCSPNGVRVAYFKAPSSLELSHDYLWRIHAALPPKGIIGVLNRSHYEDVLITRVRGWVSDKQAAKRFKQIHNFEEMLSQEGTSILKFNFVISPEEQAIQLQERIDDPTKRWKFNPGDLEERKLWDQYMKMYEEAMLETSTKAAPWYAVPGNNRWYRNYVIASIIVETLEAMKLEYPTPQGDIDWANLKVV
jgi:PPK2 family polyphosphate:nucleotide phosphotransferase